MAKQQQKKPQEKHVEMIAVRATSRGFDGLVMREDGDEFQLPASSIPGLASDGTPSTWWEPVDGWTDEQLASYKVIALEKAARARLDQPATGAKVMDELRAMFEELIGKKTQAA